MLNNQLDNTIEYEYDGKLFSGYVEFNLNKFDGIVYLVTLNDNRKLRLINKDGNIINSDITDVNTFELSLIINEIIKIYS